MEESNELTLVKPEFNGEIQAKIKSLGEIESNIKEVQNYAIELNNYYKNIIFTEETMKIAKDEKAKVNKFKKIVEDYRKKTIEEWKKPIMQFETLSKDTEKILSDTYATINFQVANYEYKQKQEKEQEIKDYFEEYKKSLDIDFIKFEDTKIRVGLSDSKISLKKQVKDFIDRVNTDLATIMLQEHKEEILVEYKQNGYILSTAISTVINRIKAVEETKRKQEELKQKQLEEAQRIADENIKIQTEATKQALDNFRVTEQEVLQAPIIEEKQEEVLILKFTVKGTRTKLRALKEFLTNGGYEYE
jgi:hypothetical protein